MGITFKPEDQTPIYCNVIPTAETTDDCTVYVKYSYTVTNVGPTNENIISIFSMLNGNVKDLTYALDTTELVPGYDVATNKIISIGICQEVTTIRVSADVDETSPSGVICKVTAEYEFVVDKI